MMPETSACVLSGELAKTFLADYAMRQPRSATFAEHAIKHVARLLGDLMAVDISERTVLKYQTDRLSEGASPKTVNEEVGFLLRLLPVAHAGAIRAQLKHLQWSGLDLVERLVTVGESKTDAGTGRTIPMNAELCAAAVEYAKWYTSRFGATQPDWYVFPAGRPRPNDPTKPQSSIKTAWRNARKKANVEGRFHDNRHTFVTDLAESGAGDEVIRDMAGHVSKDMLKHYSHIRMQAKRRAVEALTKKAASETHSNAPTGQNSEVVVQDSVQVTPVN
jgi:hypothetical protein